jgi:uncharacterized protein (DUF2252 family)
MNATTQIRRAAGATPKKLRRVLYLTVPERVARGKAARAEVPRSSHAVFDPSSTRPDPIELLERQAETRVPGLVPIRYGRMLVSPFTFYRGGALIMAQDLAGTPRSGFTVQCCGDAHLSNFGAFASPERRLVFDINDFDETLPGPWEWDVKRLAVSMLVAARDNGFARKDQHRVVLASEMKAKQLHRNEALLAKARTRDNMTAFSKLTHAVNGQVQIVNQPPLIVPVEQFGPTPRDEVLDALRELLRRYRASLQFNRRVLLERYQIADFARKVVGVGSVGTRAFIALLVGRDNKDPLFLQAKEAEASVLEEFVGPSRFRNHGERVVTGQRLMQATSDIFLGWLHVESGMDGKPRDFYVRQLKDWKASAEIEQMNPRRLSNYGRLCGWTLARAHARGGDNIAIAAYLGNGSSFDRAIVEFSNAYAEQNDRDYQALADAVNSGRISAETGL